MLSFLRKCNKYPTKRMKAACYENISLNSTREVGTKMSPKKMYRFIYLQELISNNGFRINPNYKKCNYTHMYACMYVCIY